MLARGHLRAHDDLDAGGLHVVVQGLRRDGVGAPWPTSLLNGTVGVEGFEQRRVVGKLAQGTRTLPWAATTCGGPVTRRSWRRCGSGSDRGLDLE